MLWGTNARKALQGTQGGGDDPTPSPNSFYLMGDARMNKIVQLAIGSAWFCQLQLGLDLLRTYHNDVLT